MGVGRRGRILGSFVQFVTPFALASPLAFLDSLLLGLGMQVQVLKLCHVIFVLGTIENSSIYPQLLESLLHKDQYITLIVYFISL